jgi:hypothetical protein
MKLGIWKTWTPNAAKELKMAFEKLFKNSSKANVASLKS